MTKKFNEKFDMYLPEKDVNYYKSELTEIPDEYRGKKIDGQFNVAGNSLTSLENGPLVVTKQYSANDNNLTSLEGAPIRADRLSIDNNPDLGSLSGIADKAYGSFSCANCGLTDLTGLPKVTKFLDASNNPLKSLDGLERNKNYKGGIKVTGTGIKRSDVEEYCEKHGIKFGTIQD